MPSAVNAIARTHPSWPFRTRRQRPDSSSQTRTVSSAPPVATRPRRASSAIALTSPSWPARFRSGFPVVTSQTRASPALSVISPDPETATRPSGLIATAFTSLVSPTRILAHTPSPTSQRRSSRSRLPESTRAPSAVSATELTRRVWPRRGSRAWSRGALIAREPRAPRPPTRVGCAPVPPRPSVLRAPQAAPSCRHSTIGAPCSHRWRKPALKESPAPVVSIVTTG